MITCGLCSKEVEQTAYPTHLAKHNDAKRRESRAMRLVAQAQEPAETVKETGEPQEEPMLITIPFPGDTTPEKTEQELSEIAKVLDAVSLSDVRKVPEHESTKPPKEPDKSDAFLLEKLGEIKQRLKQDEEKQTSKEDEIEQIGIIAMLKKIIGFPFLYYYNLTQLYEVKMAEKHIKTERKITEEQVRVVKAREESIKHALKEIEHRVEDRVKELNIEDKELRKNKDNLLQENMRINLELTKKYKEMLAQFRILQNKYYLVAKELEEKTKIQLTIPEGIQPLVIPVDLVNLAESFDYKKEQKEIIKVLLIKPLTEENIALQSQTQPKDVKDVLRIISDNHGMITDRKGEQYYLRRYIQDDPRVEDEFFYMLLAEPQERKSI